MSVQKERIDHINLVTWFNYQFPELADDLHHFANERICSPQQGRILKRMGVKKGVPDFFLAVPIGIHSGFWLELKVGKNKPTESQLTFLARKTDLGYFCKICYGFEEAKECISNYLRLYSKYSSNNEPKIPV